MTASQANPPIPGPFGSGEGVRIVRVTEAMLIPAVSRLVTVSARVDEDAAHRFLAYAEENGISLACMFAAVGDENHIEATALAVPNPGKTAMCFASRIGRGRLGSVPEQVSRIATVLNRTCDEAAGNDVRVAQALLEPREKHELRAFEQAGFQTLATLSYLQRSVSLRQGERSPLQWPPDVTLEPYHTASEPAFVEALDRSYEETMDCPDLCGLRATSDILLGHRATGRFEQELWTLLRIDDQPSGVLMLNPAVNGRSVELVYLGLAAAARGRGLARMLLQHGLNQIAARPERTISLAVDERNTPAKRLYFSAGFRRLLRRVALIRPLP